MPSTERKIIFGAEAINKIHKLRDHDPSPLRQSTMQQQDEEVDRCVQVTLDEVPLYIPEISNSQTHPGGEKTSRSSLRVTLPRHPGVAKMHDVTTSSALKYCSKSRDLLGSVRLC